MTLDKFNQLGLGTDLVNVNTNTRFQKTGRDNVTWHGGQFFSNVLHKRTY